nr:dienelactone hydrolase family protein [Candidatus Frankia alpina]
MTEETVVLPTADGPAPATLAEPAGPARGGVIILHEAFGLTEHVQGLCSRFALAGWRAIAPDLFHRVGSPVFAYDDVASAIKVVEDLDGTDLLDDVDAAPSPPRRGGDGAGPLRRRRLLPGREHRLPGRGGPPVRRGDHVLRRRDPHPELR